MQHKVLYNQAICFYHLISIYRYLQRSRSRSRSISPRRNNSQPKFCILIHNLTTRCRWVLKIKKTSQNLTVICFSWQDLKDFVRKETKVETAFCQAHRDKVGEGLGEFFMIYETSWTTILYNSYNFNRSWKKRKKSLSIEFKIVMMFSENVTDWK